MNKRVAEIVEKYLSQGYRIDFGAMGNPQQEIVTADLVNGKKIIKVQTEKFVFEKIRAFQILGRILDRWTMGNAVRGLKRPPLAIIQILLLIYEEIKLGRQPEFICDDAAEVLRFCKFKIQKIGIGWRVV